MFLNDAAGPRAASGKKLERFRTVTGQPGGANSAAMVRLQGSV